MKLECLVKLKVDPRFLESVFEALYPETLRLSSKRVSVAFTKAEDSIILKFNAKDPTALRAALNSYLRWFSAVERCLKLIDVSQPPGE